MVWTKHQSLVVALLIITGTTNTITAKWLNILEAVGSDDKEPRRYIHPFLLALVMFLGQIMCLVTFKILYFHYHRKQDGSEDEMKLLKGNRIFNPCILLVPAMCDMIASSLLNIAIVLTYAASFQMLRGAVIVFVGLLSMCFLKRKISLQEWGGIFVVILGLALIGLADYLAPTSDLSAQDYNIKDIIIGDVLIVLTQIILAIQMVWEEKHVMKHDIPPLQAAGWEGVFGAIVIAVLLVPFYFIPVPKAFSGNPRNVVEDAIDGLVQMYNNLQILCGSLIFMVSIAFFNFAGISVTKELSATTRQVFDSVRTFFVWIFTLGVGWQEFFWLQIIGFLLLVTGTLVYNKAFTELRRYYYKRKHAETTADEENLPSAADEDTEDSLSTRKSTANVPENKQT